VSVRGVDFVYRQLGPQGGGVPLILLHHLTAVLDNWDPRVVDGLAARRQVIAFDNRGVGASGGSTPDTIEAMARDAVLFIRALGFEQVDLLGLSMGGFIAQVIAAKEPQLVRRVVLAGTGPAGGPGIDKVTALTLQDILKGFLTRKDPKQFLFFTDTEHGRREARAFLERLKERTSDRDRPISLTSFRAQLKPMGPAGARGPVAHPPASPGGQRRERPDGAEREHPRPRRRACPRANSSPSTRTPDTAGSSSSTTSSWPEPSPSSKHSPRPDL
jgi:pimeloyl-ACP methyl ester carboxylesterase